MTIAEAATKGICRLRDPKWAPKVSYIKLVLDNENRYGPWATLWDETQPAIGEKLGGQKVCTLLPPWSTFDGFVEYKGEIVDNDNDL